MRISWLRLGGLLLAAVPQTSTANHNDCAHTTITLPAAAPASINCFLTDGTAGKITILFAMWGGNCKCGWHPHQVLPRTNFPFRDAP